MSRSTSDCPYYMLRDWLGGSEGKSLRVLKKGHGKILNLEGKKVHRSFTGFREFLQRFLRRPRNHFTGRFETRTMARAVPRPLCFVPSDDALDPAVRFGAVYSTVMRWTEGCFD